MPEKEYKKLKESEQKSKELKEAAKPLVELLYKYGTPHSTVLVTQARTEFVDGSFATQNDLRD